MTTSNHELSILLPRSAAFTTSDDWPIFELQAVDIFDSEDPLRSSAILLHAGSYKPLTITGRLASLGKENEHLLLKQSYSRNQPIEITGVKEFSYGQYDNGKIDLWAAGDAGWYTIHPSRTYRHVYLQMLQSIRLLYFAGDSYKGVRAYADLPVEHLFHRYWDAHPDTCDSVKSAEALFDQHRYFLIASMLSGKEGLDWAKVPFFSYLESKFPDDTVTIRERLRFKPKKPASRKQSTQSPAPSNASLKRKRAAPRERTATPADSVRSQSRAQSISTATPNVVASTGTGSEVRPRRRGRPNKSSLKPAIRPAVESALIQPPADPITEPAEPKVSTPQPASKMSNDGGSSEEDSSEPRQRGHKGKSVLRPRPSKYVQSKAITNDGAEDESDDEKAATVQLVAAHDSLSRRNTSSMLRMVSTLRRNSQLQIGDPDEVRIRSPDSVLDEGIDMPLDEDDDDDEAHAVGGAKDDLPVRLREDIESETDMWRCPQDGCMYKIYAASKSGSQALVTEHQRMHDHDDDKRVQLVRRMEAPWLPVGRLMGRVRELAGRNGMPSPIVQRY